MKHKLQSALALFSLVIVIFTSCSKDDKLSDPGFLEVTPSTLNIDSNGGSSTIVIKTDNLDHNTVKLDAIQKGDRWCHPNTDNQGFKITVDPFNSSLPYNERTAIVVVTLGNLKQEILVTQTK